MMFIFPTQTLIDDENYYTLFELAHIHMSTTIYMTHDTHTHKHTASTHNTHERKRTIGLHIGFRDTTRPSD